MSCRYPSSFYSRECIEDDAIVPCLEPNNQSQDSGCLGVALGPTRVSTQTTSELSIREVKLPSRSFFSSTQRLPKAALGCNATPDSQARNSAIGVWYAGAYEHQRRVSDEQSNLRQLSPSNKLDNGNTRAGSCEDLPHGYQAA